MSNTSNTVAAFLLFFDEETNVVKNFNKFAAL